jgi:hypothetical protein
LWKIDLGEMSSVSAIKCGIVCHCKAEQTGVWGAPGPVVGRSPKMDALNNV